MKSLLIFLVILSSLHAGSLKLINDTPYILLARIQAADGTKMGELTLKSNEIKTWSNYSNKRWTPNKSMTPYRVLWYCNNKDSHLFSVHEFVASGSTITATQGSGTHICPPQEEEKKKGS